MIYGIERKGLIDRKCTRDDIGGTDIIKRTEKIDKINRTDKMTNTVDLVCRVDVIAVTHGEERVIKMEAIRNVEREEKEYVT